MLESRLTRTVYRAQIRARQLALIAARSVARGVIGAVRDRIRPYREQRGELDLPGKVSELVEEVVGRQGIARLVTELQQRRDQTAALSPLLEETAEMRLSVVQEEQARREFQEQLGSLRSNMDPNEIIPWTLNQRVNTLIEEDLSAGNRRLEERPVTRIVQDHEGIEGTVSRARARVGRARAKVLVTEAVGLLVATLMAMTVPQLAAATSYHLFDWSARPPNLDHSIVLAFGAWSTALPLAMAGFSVWSSIRWIRRPGSTLRWTIWVAEAGTYLTIAGFALSWSFFSSAPDEILIWLHSSYLRVYLLAGFVPLITLVVVVAYRSTRSRFVSQENSALSYLQTAEESASQPAAALNERLELTIGRLISDVLSDVTVQLGVSRPDPWDLKVPDYDRIVPDSWKNLSEQYTPEGLVKTPDVDDIVSNLRQLDRGSIGIAGERGAGKTSLMYAIRNEIRPRPGQANEFLDVWISAPTSVTEKEFLLSVLAKLAAKVGYRLTGNSYFPNRPPQAQLRVADTRGQAMLGALALGIVGGIAAGLAVPWELTEKVGLGILILVAGPAIILSSWLLKRHVLRETFYQQKRSEDREYLHAATSVLEELWYEQKEVSEASVGLGGLGVDLTGGLRRERTRRPFTLPQLVQMWDDFVGYVTSGGEPFKKVVIFIDEVDKIKDTEEIGKFMRVLKTLYKPSNLFFIVSISEDAHEQFKLRSVARGQRNEFDSSFADNVFVKLMSDERVGELLDARIGGESMPNPFKMLVSAISRGNPRDSIRMAKDVLQWCQGDELFEVTFRLSDKYHVTPLLDQYKGSLRGRLAPKEFEVVVKALDEFSEAMATNVRLACKKLSPLLSMIDRETHLFERGASSLEQSVLEDLLNLKAGLYCVVNLRDAFGRPSTQALKQRLRRIAKNGALTELRLAQLYLQDGYPSLAWDRVGSFRAKLRLKPVTF